MKQHRYGATDKDIARWVATELEALGMPVSTPSSINKPAGLT